MVSASASTYFIFFIFSTVKQPRIIVQYSAIVGRRLAWLEKLPHPHYDDFVDFLDSINQATMTEQYENEVSSTASE